MEELEYDKSLTDHVDSLKAGDHVINACFVNGEPVLVLAEGEIVFCTANKQIKAHDDATILVSW